MQDKSANLLSLFASSSTLICCGLPSLFIVIGAGGSGGMSQTSNFMNTTGTDSTFNSMIAGGGGAGVPISSWSRDGPGPSPTQSNPASLSAVAAGKWEQRQLQQTMSSSSPFVLEAGAGGGGAAEAAPPSAGWSGASLKKKPTRP